MIITTTLKYNLSLIERVNKLLRTINGVYIKRDKKSLIGIMDEFTANDIIVVGDKYTKYYHKSDLDNPFFFHPSMAALRINRLKQGDNDLMIQVTNLKCGDTFLDCTLGLASDAIVASYIVGPTGKVVGLESQNILAAIVEDGLAHTEYKDEDLNSSMRRIEVIQADHYNRLKSLPGKSFDIVYFDPMFRIGVNKSKAISPLRALANNKSLLYDTIIEAKRVAKRKVVLKETNKSKEFEKLGFIKIIRSSSITYGVITIGENK